MEERSETTCTRSTVSMSVSQAYVYSGRGLGLNFLKKCIHQALVPESPQQCVLLWTQSPSPDLGWLFPKTRGRRTRKIWLKLFQCDPRLVDPEQVGARSTRLSGARSPNCSGYFFLFSQANVFRMIISVFTHWPIVLACFADTVGRFYLLCHWVIAGRCDGGQERQDGLSGVEMTCSTSGLHLVQTHGAEWMGREDGCPSRRGRNSLVGKWPSQQQAWQWALL